jgi:hypothetical protein
MTTTHQDIIQEHIRASLDNMLSSRIDRSSAKHYILNMMQEYTDRLRQECVLVESDVYVSAATGWVVRTNKHHSECWYTLDSGLTHRVTRQFKGRRSARVYGKRNWKWFQSVDMHIVPVVPAEMIRVNVLVSGANDENTQA